MKGYQTGITGGCPKFRIAGGFAGYAVSWGTVQEMGCQQEILAGSPNNDGTRLKG